MNKNNNLRDINKISVRECIHHIKQQTKQDDTNTPDLTSACFNKTHKMSIIVKQTHHDLVQYLHAACFSPVSSTWNKAIKNNNFTLGRDSPWN